MSNKTQQPVRSSTEVLSAPQGGYCKQKGKPCDLKNDRQMICRYCKQQHWSDQCMKYPTLKERKSVVKGCCFNCLRSGHFVKQCTANHWCVYCQKESNHHRSLCPNRFSSGTTEGVNVADEEPIEDSPPPVFNTKEQPEATTLAAGDTVLMQTALVNVKNPNGSKTEHIRVFLDSGSHRSYITESWPRSCNLIGNDYYLDLLLPESKHPVSGHDHLFLLATTLGFVLAGRINSDIPMENDFCSISMFIENSLPVKPNLEEFGNLRLLVLRTPLMRQMMT